MVARATDGLIVVTGGSGFLGRAIVARLLRDRRTVSTLQRSDAVQPGATVVRGDIRDRAAVDRALSGAAGVIHTAGLAHVFHAGDAPFTDINEHGTSVVVRAAVEAGVEHVVLVSSVAVYGSPGRSADESTPCRPRTPYAASKFAAEQRAIEAVAGSTMRLTILRMTTLYGEGDRGNVQRLLEALASGRFVPVGSARNRKSLIHVDDAARACVLPVCSNGEPLEIFNVAAQEPQMRDVVAGLARGLGRRAPVCYVPAAMAGVGVAALAAVRPALGRMARANLAKWLADDVYPAQAFARRFGFEPAVTLEQGLERQVSYWRRHSGTPHGNRP